MAARFEHTDRQHTAVTRQFLSDVLVLSAAVATRAQYLVRSPSALISASK